MSEGTCSRPWLSGVTESPRVGLSEGLLLSAGSIASSPFKCKEQRVLFNVEESCTKECDYLLDSAVALGSRFGLKRWPSVPEIAGSTPNIPWNGLC